MLRCWKTWIPNLPRLCVALACLIAVNAVGSFAHAQNNSPVGPTPIESSGPRSTARIISGMIQFEPSQPIRQTPKEVNTAPVQPQQQRLDTNFPLSKNTYHNRTGHGGGAGHGSSQSYGLRKIPYIDPDPNRQFTQQRSRNGRANSGVRPASLQQNIRNPNVTTQTNSIDPIQRYAPHFEQGFHGVRTSQDFGPAPRTAPSSIPRYLIPPRPSQPSNSILNKGSARSRGNGYNNAGFSLRQDEDPFGDNQFQQDPRSNNNSGQDPFGSRPQEGRVDPFADPPPENNQNFQDNPPNNLPQEVPRNDPFPDNPREQDPRQNIDPPPIPGRIPDLSPGNREIPVPDPYPNGDNTPDQEIDPRRNPSRPGGARNPFTRSSKPIRRAPTTHYEPRRNGQPRDQYGIPYTEYADTAGTQDFNSYHQQYSYPPSAPTTYVAPEYDGIADEVGFNAFLGSGLNQPSYSCCEPLFYVSIFGGYASAEFDGDALERDAAVPTIGNYDLEDGFGFGFAVGQTQGANLRTELEYSFRSNDGRTFQLSNLPDLDLSGDVNSSSGMLNFVWDFNNVSFIPRVRPYIGGGIGFSFVDADLDSDNGALHTTDIDADSAFAWQIMAGVTYQFSTSMNLFLEYRYFETDSITLESNPNGATPLFGQFDYQVNNVFAGFRLRF